MGFAASRTTTKVYWLCKLGTVPDSPFGRAGLRRAELDGLAVLLDLCLRAPRRFQLDVYDHKFILCSRVAQHNG